MITRLRVRNFKRFGEVDIPLGSPVVFVGPNNSGKTTALQALALWEMGLKTRLEKRGEKSKAKERVGIVINRRDLVQLPFAFWPSAELTPTHAATRVSSIRSTPCRMQPANCPNRLRPRIGSLPYLPMTSPNSAIVAL